MELPNRHFYVQDQNGKWGLCIRQRGIDLPTGVRYDAQTVFEVNPQTGLFKLLKARDRSHPPGFPTDWRDIKEAKRMSGIYDSGITRLAKCFVEASGQTYKDDSGDSIRLCFAYQDETTGFYVGLPPDDFKDIVGQYAVANPTLPKTEACE